MMLPGMLLQPLIENAVIHGVGEMLQGALVIVSVNRRNGAVYLTVEDNGRGMGWGLEDYGGFCLVIAEKSAGARLHGIIKAALEELGNRLVSGFFDNHPVLCVMIKGPVKNEVIDNICNFIQGFLRNQGCPNIITLREIVPVFSASTG